MNFVICDDDPDSVRDIEEMVLLYFKIRHLQPPLIHTFSSAQKMLRSSCVYDIAFLDVVLPGISGLIASRELKKRNRRIMIFIITGFSDTYLDESFEEGVYRYLTKPVSMRRLHTGLRSALIRLSSPCKSLLVRTTTETRRISTEDILIVHTSLRTTGVVTTTDSLICPYPFSFWKQTLPEECFMETHKGYLVNLTHIRSFDQDRIQMDDLKTIAYLSKRNYSEFKKRFLLFLENE